MAILRVRFKLNPGRKGLGLSKLSKQAENIEQFLRSLAVDVGADGATQTWLATNFKEGSFVSDMEHQSFVEEDQVAAMNLGIMALAQFRSLEQMPAFLSPATIDRFASLRNPLDDGEKFGVAIFDEKTGRPGRYKYVDKLKLIEISAAIDTEVRYLGSVMGTTHGWHKGAEPPYLIVRDITNGDLVRCTYRDRDYSKVSNIFTKKSAVVVIEGTVLFNRITGKSEVTEATEFSFAPEFSDDDFEAFFGCAPGLTGDRTSEDVISKGRDDE